MKTLNEYGQGVMKAQQLVDSLDENIATAEAALDHLKVDRIDAQSALDAAKRDLQAATDRIKAGDYGVEPEPSQEEIEAILNDAEPFPGIDAVKQADPYADDERTQASNGAGF